MEEGFSDRITISKLLKKKSEVTHPTERKHCFQISEDIKNELKENYGYFRIFKFKEGALFSAVIFAYIENLIRESNSQIDLISCFLRK